MSRDKPVLRAIKLLTLIERHPNGLRVADMAEQLNAPSTGDARGLFLKER
jgi:DNA-binding IclR family transcriptional regulator